MVDLPSVTVTIPTHDRPVEVRRAIEHARTQDYEGDIDVIVVYDGAAPDLELQTAPDARRPVRVLSNERTRGLAGARNTATMHATGDLVAFCDDDDYWDAGKIRRQVAALASAPQADLVTCAIAVEYEGRSTPRLAGVDRVTHPMLVRSRMAMLHSSTFVFRRSSLLGRLGLIDEAIPGSQNEDWDILLRAAEIQPIVHVDQPLVHVVWGSTSFFSRRWDTKIDSSIWMLERHPMIRSDRKAASRLMGQIAFAHACSGDRRRAAAWSYRTARQNPLQPRWPLAAAVSVWPRSGGLVLNVLHRLGRGV